MCTVEEEAVYKKEYGLYVLGRGAICLKMS